MFPPGGGALLLALPTLAFASGDAERFDLTASWVFVIAYAW
jgi:hypothetical protein